MLAQLLSAEVFGYLLVFARVGAAVMLLPGIGDNYVAPRIRLGLALALAAVIYPLVREVLPALPSVPGELVVLVSGEVLYGAFIGGAARLMISSLHVAGVVMAFQSGLAYAQTMDPNQGTQGALLSTLLTLMGVVLIFASGLHAVMLAAINDSYALFPPGRLPPLGGFADLAVSTVAGSFALGIKIAAPFIVFGIVFYTGLGMLQRLIPQVQLFFVAMPLQVALGLFMLMVVLSAAMLLFLSHFEAQATRLLAPPER